MKKIISTLYPWVIVAILIYLASRALFHEGFFRTIDDVTTVRIQHLVKELELGRWRDNFPVRWGSQMAHTYGYPFYLFYSPLVYYVGAVIQLGLNLSDIVATKFVYFLPLVFGPILFYWSARSVVGTWPALIATMLYTFFPYRGFDTYFRGGVGESWAIGFLPGLIGAFTLVNRKIVVGYPLISIFLGLIILSHNISGLLIFGLCLLYGLTLRFRDLKYWGSLLVGLAISAFFWLPSIYYLPLIRANTLPLNTSNLITSLIPIYNLVKFDFAYSASQAYTPVFFYLLVASLIATYWYKNRHSYIKEYLFWAITSLVLYLSMSQVAILLWEYSLPITRLLQFPWRLLIILSATIPLTIAYFLEHTSKMIIRLFITSIILLLSSQFIVSFRPKEYSYFYNYSLEDTGPCATGDFEDYFPHWVKQCINRPPEKSLFLTKDGNLEITSDKVSELGGNYASNTDNTIMIHRYYFPGWIIKVDGEPLVIDYNFNDSGIMEVKVPAGNHTFQAYFSKTPIMWFADIISMVSILLLLGTTYFAIKKTYVQTT